MFIHDNSVDRTSSNHMTGEIGKFDQKDLSVIKVGYSKKFGYTFEDENIPTLWEALKLAKGKMKVCIERKVFGAEEEILQIINDMGVKEDAILFLFHYPVLAKIRQQDKNIRMLFLINNAGEIDA